MDKPLETRARRKFHFLKMAIFATLGFCALVVLSIVVGIAIGAKQEMAIALPLIAGFIPFPLLLHSLIKKQNPKALAYLVSLLASLPFGMWGAWMVLISIGMSARSGMRW